MALCLVFLVLLVTGTFSRQPNIVLMLADDLGMLMLFVNHFVIKISNC